MKRSVSIRLLLALLALQVTGCGTSYLTVHADGLYYTRYGYTVLYAHQASRRIIHGPWIIDNLHKKDGSDWVMNQGSKYYGTCRIDRDGDGTYEHENVYFFDLKLNHRSSNAVLWIQNQELSKKVEGKSLEVLLANYAESLTGAGFYAEANIFSLLTVKQKRYVAVIREKKASKLGPYQALTARIQVLNLDQRKVEPNHQGDTIQLTLLKIPFRHPSSRQDVDFEKGQSVMIVGYHNATAAFPSQLAAYQSLLKQIHFLWR